MRNPTKITVQYRHVPHLPPQVRITRHYGRGVPREYHCVVAKPRTVESAQWAEWVADNIRTADNGWPDPVILPDEVTVYA